MTVHVLDNPVWASLGSSHRDLALGQGDLLRYPPDVAPFLGVSGPGALDLDDLEALVREDESVFLVGPGPTAPHGWKLEQLGTLVQMVCEELTPDGDGPTVAPLEGAHRAAVLELTALVYPHYFRPQTMRLGRYFGIFEDGRLAAMIGERMGMPGFREISAVCTHPTAAGRGYARRLLVWLANDILAEGSTPFLHVSPANERARYLYEQNGFRTRSEPAFWSLSKVDPT